MRREILRMDRVNLIEHGVMQLDGFTLSVLEGEVSGLLPINNHGLTALFQLLQYNTPLRYGYVYYKEKQINTWRASKSRQNRIGLIQSESSLVEGLSVADNIFILRKSWWIRSSVLYKQLFPFLEQAGIYISADTYIGELTPFEKVVVDILKAVMAGCKLIVLREIKASITDGELKKVYALLRHYTRQGISFLYVDFDFEELRRLCDHVALMSNGRIIKKIQRGADFAAHQIYPSAYIHEMAQPGRFDASCLERRFVFEVKSEGEDFLSFMASPGECVVLQSENEQTLGKLLRELTGGAGGKLMMNHRETALGATREFAVIQELPTHTMLFHELSYMDNLCFSLDHRLSEVWRSGRVREGIRQENIARLGEEVFDKRVDRLSEMEKYELIYYRIALQKPKLVFIVKPFRRADVELRMHIWGLLKMLIDKKICVVILTINPSEYMPMADKLILMHKNKQNEVYLREEFYKLSPRHG